MRTTVEQIQTAGFTMDYFRFGNPEGKPAVILPGISILSVMNYADAVVSAYAELAEDHDVYLLDRRKDLPDMYSIGEMAEDTYTALRSLGLEKADLYGVSQGGMMAMIIAVNHPEFVRKLALASTTCRAAGAEENALEKWISLAENKDARGLTEQFGEYVYSKDYYGQNREAILSMANYVKEEDLERFVILAKSMRAYDISGRLKDIKCPVLVMGGAEDRILHEGALKEIADALNGELHVYEGYGHAVYDEAEDFIPRIHAFFNAETHDTAGSHPKVSIIVPVYNGEKVISKCINSVLNQEYKDWELILVNDGSKDNTAVILDEYALHDDRIRVIHKPNGGVSSTRNRGLSEAKGDYIQFMDADDWLTEDSTKVLVRTIEEGGADMAVADFYRVVGDLVSRKGSILSNDVLTVKEYAEWMKESPADYYYGVLWNKLYKRSVIEQYKLRMDESVSLCEDYLFNLEYLLHCEKVAPVQIPVYYYLKTEGSLVASNLNLKKIVNMKTSVFDYYDKFYRSVFNEEEYEKNRVEIAKFLVSAATDDGALPFLPGTKKLGEEKIQVHYEPGHTTNIVETTYFLTKVFDKYMNSVAMKYDLDIKDLRIFYVIMRVGPIHDQKQITDFTGIPLASVLLSLEKLISRGLIRVTIELPEYEAELTEKAADIVKDLDNAVKDMEELCFSGFSEEDAESVRNAVRRITDTLRDSLTR